MDRFGADLQKLFLERGNRFPRVVVAQMALRLIDSLHYLHDNRYVHADIKAANILLPFSKAAKQPPVKTVYLVDFGLTAKYADSDGTHKPYKQVHALGSLFWVCVLYRMWYFSFVCVLCFVCVFFLLGPVSSCTALSICAPLPIRPQIRP